MKYVEQSHKDLRLYLTEKGFDKDRFTVISETEFMQDDIHFTFGILAESHYVSIETPGMTFCEICACTDVTLPDSDSIYLKELGDANKKSTFGGYSYSFNYEITNMKVGEVRLAALQSKRPHPHSRYLEHEFPTSKSNEKSAITEIYITTTNGIIMESVHTYPNHDAMVFTTSQLSKN